MNNFEAKIKLSDGELSSTVQGSLNGMNAIRAGLGSGKRSNGDLRNMTRSSSSHAIDLYDFSTALVAPSAYMKVIRESKKAALKRERLSEQKHKILGMTFDGNRR